MAGRLLLAAPDQAFLAALADAQDLPGTVADDHFDKTWSHLTRAAAAMPAELVAEEFTALFEGLGSPLLDPYASVYVAGFMMEKPLASLRCDLATLGLARSRSATVPEDHLGALCEIMRLLIAGAPHFAPQPLAAQRRFFETADVPQARRRFFKAALCAPALAVAASAAPVAAPVAVAPEAMPPRQSNYHETPHIRTYYDLAAY